MADQSFTSTTTTETLPATTLPPHTNYSVDNNYGGYNSGYNSAYPPQRPVNGRGRKFKPYRNRPSKAQALLEILSFCLLLASVPSFLGGTLSIFVFYFALILGFMGLFAWTRRHAVMLSLLAFAVIILAIVNIVLRSQNQGNCMPYFYYRNLFVPAVVVAPIGGTGNTNSTQTNSTAPIGGTGTDNNNSTNTNNNSTTVPVVGGNNSTDNSSRIARQVNAGNGYSSNFPSNNGNGFGNLINGGNGNFDGDDDDNDYDNSLWCGGRKIVYITNAIIIALAIPILILALSLLRQKRRAQVPAVAQTQQTVTKTIRSVVA